MSITPTASVHEENAQVFGFLRKRAQFVAEYDDFDALVAWGPIVDAVATIHARRNGRSIKKNAKCFREGLAGLVRFIDLTTISLPLLHQELRRLLEVGYCDAVHVAATLFGSPRAAPCQRGQLWTAELDAARQADVVAAMQPVRTETIRRAITHSTYAHVLYADYRCALVHGLDFGWRTWEGDASFERGAIDAVPRYMNYSYPSDDARPNEHRQRFRISFSKGFLVRVLDEIIAHEEAQCTAAEYVIGPYATRRD